ncbi:MULTISPECIES: OmpA family protein [Marinobacter]|uniref:OmpA family protein n=1 Tax=Marinobacter TaxID=2742 RepID=UPI000DAC9E73|nr:MULTISPECIES: OmpA family protein [Marinobacter]
MNRTWMSRSAGALLVIIAVALIPFLNSQGALEQPVSLTVLFDRGTDLDDDAAMIIAKAVRESLARPEAGILVTGYTGSRGDEQANLALSERRAEFIKSRLEDKGIEPERIDTVGLGGTEALERKEGESDRAYQRRLARADILINP